MEESKNSSKTLEKRTAVWQRLPMLRLVVLIFLAIITFLVGSLSYQQLFTYEEILFKNEFSALTLQAVNKLETVVNVKFLSLQIIGSIYRNFYPQKESWFEVASEGMNEIGTIINQLSAVTNIAFLPLVTADQAPSFENFALCAKETTVLEGADQFSSGKSIAEVNATFPGRDYFFHYKTGETYWSSPVNKLIPFLQNYEPNASPLLIGYHSEQDRGQILERIIECSESHEIIFQSDVPHCQTIRGLVSPRFGPSVEFFEPIYLKSDDKTLVGITTGISHWEDILTGLFPHFDYALDCVIQGGGGTFTFRMEYGTFSLVSNETDEHDRDFDRYKEHTELFTAQNLAGGTPLFTATFYPTRSMYNSFHSWVPVLAMVVGTGLILLSSVMFLVYDYFAKQESLMTLRLLETKRKFVRFISHEIRTPLNTVCLGLELLKSELREVTECSKQPPAMLEIDTLIKTTKTCVCTTKDVLDNALDAVGVLNDLLNYDKVEMGTLRLDISVVDIKDTISHISSTFGVQAAQKAINLKVDDSGFRQEKERDLETEIGVSKIFVLGDPARLEQVLRNLVSNALKFTPSGGDVSLTVRLLSVEDLIERRLHQDLLKLETQKDSELDRFKNENCTHFQPCGYVELSVQDSGVGLTEAQVALIGTEGLQFDANQLQAGQGSGLGVNISKGFVRQHGGLFFVSSQGMGTGTKFTIVLPGFIDPSTSESTDQVVNSESKEVSEVTAPHTPTTDGSSPLRARELWSKSILVVDDSPLNRKMLVKMLEKLGHSCEEAMDGFDAVEKYQAKILNTQGKMNYDTILMDYEMPQMNGPAACERLRSLGCQCLIVGITGNLLKEDVDFF